MRIMDLEECQLVVGMRVRSLSKPRCGTIVRVELDNDHLAWVQWDGEDRPTSGFYGNDCECEVVLNSDGLPEIRKIDGNG